MSTMLVRVRYSVKRVLPDFFVAIIVFIESNQWNQTSYIRPYVKKPYSKLRADKKIMVPLFVSFRLEILILSIASRPIITQNLFYCDFINKYFHSLLSYFTHRYNTSRSFT